ncbi:MAG: hypothetical protein LBC04_01125 [Holosporaceae bacterium]|jgi:hypothetical protein|nr:hypothetical protein [Holosporaceae bacterium]
MKKTIQLTTMMILLAVNYSANGMSHRDGLNPHRGPSTKGLTDEEIAKKFHRFYKELDPSLSVKELSSILSDNCNYFTFIIADLPDWAKALNLPQLMIYLQEPTKYPSPAAIAEFRAAQDSTNPDLMKFVAEIRALGDRLQKSSKFLKEFRFPGGITAVFGAQKNRYAGHWSLIAENLRQLQGANPEAPAVPYDTNDPNSTSESSRATREFGAAQKPEDPARLEAEIVELRHRLEDLSVRVDKLHS